MHFSLSAVNENADEYEIPLSAEKRKRKSPVPISQYGSVANLNIFGPMQMRFLKRKRKIKQKLKLILAEKETKLKMSK